MKKVLLTISIILFALVSFGQDAKYKSLFIYNFTKHVGWPDANKTGDFVIGVYGSPDVLSSLQGITAGKSAGSQKIVVIELETLDNLDNIHILFVSADKSGGDKFAEVLSKVGSRSILVVTERTGLAKKGSHINFILHAGKIKFELNKANITNQKLQVSSYLENMAIII